MKVILLQDVKSLGKEGEIVNVSDGYARNYVIPKKLGVEANDKNKNDLKLKKQREAKEAAERLADAQKLAKDLEKVTVVVTMKAEEAVFSVLSVPKRSPRKPKSSTIWIWTKKRSSFPIPLNPSGISRSRSGCIPR